MEQVVIGSVVTSKSKDSAGVVVDIATFIWSLVACLQVRKLQVQYKKGSVNINPIKNYFELVSACEIPQKKTLTKSVINNIMC